MRAQVDYLIGRASFPYPADPKFSGKTVVQKFIDAVPRAIIHWTANGLDGAGWKWIAQSDAQAQAQLDINRMLLGTPYTPPAPPPAPPDPVAKLQADFDQFRAATLAVLATMGGDVKAATDRLDAIAFAAGRSPAPRTAARADSEPSTPARIG
jgi:hypothetical protein